MSSKLKLIESYLNKKKKHYRRDTLNGLVFEDILIFAQFYETFKKYYNESKGNAEDIHTKIKQQDKLLGVVMSDLGMTDIFDAYKESEYKSKEYKVNYKDILLLYIHLHSVHIMYDVFNDIQIKHTPVSATNNIIFQPPSQLYVTSGNGWTVGAKLVPNIINQPPSNDNNNNNSITQPHPNKTHACSFSINNSKPSTSHINKYNNKTSNEEERYYIQPMTNLQIDSNILWVPEYQSARKFTILKKT